MEIKLNLEPSTISRFTTTAASVKNPDKILFKDAMPTTLETEPIYIGMIDSVIRLTTCSEGIFCHFTVSAKSKKDIFWMHISRTPKTEFLMEPFKRAGMYLSKITCGISYSTGTMYVNPKMCRELSRTSDELRHELFAYLYSLVGFMYALQKKGLTIGVGNMGKCNYNCTFEEFLKYIPKFKDASAVWYIREPDSEDLTSITYGINQYSKVISDYTTSKPLQIGIIDGKLGVRAVVALPIASKTYTFVIDENIITTDYDLCLFECNSDSICTHIVHPCSKTTALLHCNTEELPLSNEDVLREPDTESTAASLGGIYTWVNKMLSGVGTLADVDAFTYLKAFGVNVSSGFTVSPDEMKEQYKDDEYAQELYKQVQPYYDTFELENLEANLKGFATGAIYAMAFIGASGTGKSTAARVLPSRCGLPYVSVNFSVNIEESDLFGAMVPNPNKLSAEDAEFVWQDGIVTRAIRNGYCVVLEELNFARPGVLGKLNSLLDENRQIDLSNGEIVRAHPNFRIIATCNIAYEGTNRFNKALINRFDDVTVFEDLTREKAIKVIKERTGYTNSAKIAKVYDVYEALKKFSKEQGVEAVVSMRQLLNLFTKGKYYKNALDAVKRIMLNGAFIEDAEYGEVFEETVLPAFDLKFKI